MLVLFNMIVLRMIKRIDIAIRVLYLLSSFINTIIGMIFCQVKRIVRFTQFTFLLNFIIQVLNGNIPIFMKIEVRMNKNVSSFLCSHAHP